MSGNQEAGVKPFARPLSLDVAGVPIKKRRFIRPPSPPPEEESSEPAKKDAAQKEDGSPSEKLDDSRAAKAASTLSVSDTRGSFVPNEMEKTCADPDAPSGYNAVKVGPSVLGLSDLSALSDKEAKLLVPEKSVCVASSTVDGVSNSRLREFVKEKSDQERERGSVLIMSKAPANADLPIARGSELSMSKALGNPDLSLGLEAKSISSLRDCKNHKSSGVQGSNEVVSLNLSLSNEESHDGGPDITANRSNWDLNTTMDTWENSGIDGADHSKPISEPQDVKSPMCSAGKQETSFNYINKQLLYDNADIPRTGDTVSQTAERSTHEDSLNLRLSPLNFSLNIGQEAPSSSTNKQFSGSISNTSSPSFLSHNVSKVSSGAVKTEPVDEGVRLDSMGASATAVPPLKSTTVKAEIIERASLDVLRSLHFIPTNNSIAPGIVKPEPFHEVSLRTPETTEAPSTLQDKSVLIGQTNIGHSTPPSPDISALNGCQPMDKQVLECKEITGKSASLPVLSKTGNTSEDFGDDSASGSHQRMELANKAGEGGDSVPPAKNFPCGGEVGHEAVVQGMADAASVEDKIVNSPEKSKMIFVDNVAPAKQLVHPTGEEEKVSSSRGIVEEESCCSDYESDGNSVPMDIEEDARRRDDVEDGALPAPGNDAAVGVISEVHETDCANEVCHDVRSSGEPQGHCMHAQLHPKAMENPSEDPVTADPDVFKYVTLEEGRTEDSHRDDYVDEPLVVQIPPCGADESKSVVTSQKELPNMSGEALNVLGTDQLSNQAHCGGQESSVTVAQDTVENVKLNDVDKNELQLPTVEAPLGDDSAKDPGNGSHRSRIINLSRASTEVAPSKTRSIGSHTLTSYASRERLPDGPLEGDRLHPRERNDFCYNEGFHRFSRERHQDRRNYQMNYARGRGRLSDGTDSLRAARTSEHNFLPEFSDCLSEYGVPKNKYVAAAAASAVAAAEADAKYANHNIGRDDVFVGAGRGRRKAVDDEAENFHRPPSRRRSPGGRDAARGIQMTRRVSRNINEDGAEGVGLRRTEKFMRGIPTDIERPYSRNQRPYEGVDSHFGHGARNISSIHRRAPPRFHSKSPIRSRSPGPWPSSKKRSPDAFDGPSDLPHRASPPIYRMDRMRSPDHPGFPTEVVTRRHGSPPFLSRANELRELDSSRDHVHSRSVISSRSPISRVVLRNDRRFGVGNPRDRTDGDEFVTGPMHSGRFHEVGDGDVEDRRRFGERRGPVRSFRPSFNGPDEENYPVSSGERPLRFMRNDDQQFHERVNLRERPFERGMKNRSVNAPRRPRVIEEEEGNYTGQGLYHDDPDDISRLKRKRF